MKANERPADVDKLPKRFRDYIGALESDVEALRRQLPSMASKEGARVKLVDALHAGRDVFLRDGAVLEFPFKVGGRIVELRVQYARNRMVAGLEVSATGSGLAVYPEVSNVVTVAPKDL